MNNPFPPPQQRTRLKPPRLLLLFGLVCAVQLLFAQYTWVGNDNKWSNVNNYVDAFLNPPANLAALASQEVIIPTAPAGGNWPSTTNVTPLTFRRLTLQIGARATIPIGMQLLVTGGSVYGVSLADDASLSVAGELRVSGTGYGILNYGGTLNNSGTLIIYDVTDGGILNTPLGAASTSEVFNSGDLIIGTFGTGGSNGIRNADHNTRSAEFTNTGMITIRNVNLAGILNENGANGTFFENRGEIYVFASGNTGIRNRFDATFQNLSGGAIFLDEANRAIWQEQDGAFFNDGGTITVNDNFPTTNVSYGLVNDGGSLFANINGALYQANDVLQQGIRNVNALVQNIGATIRIGTSADFGILTTSTTAMTTFVNGGGGVIQLCNNGTASMSALRNQNMSTFLNGGTDGTPGHIAIVGSGEDALQNTAIFVNGPGASTLKVGSGIMGCMASPLPMFGILNTATGTFTNKGAGLVDISFTMENGIRNAGIFQNLQEGIHTARILIDHSNAMTAGFRNQASAIFTQSGTVSLEITGTALYGFRNFGQVNNTQNASIDIQAGASAGWLNEGGSLANSGSALLRIGTLMNHGIRNGNFPGSGIANTDCAVIETASKIQNDAPFINEAILKTTFTGVHMGLVPIVNDGIVIDPKNSFDSDLGLRTANSALVNNADGVIVAPVYSCPQLGAGPVIIPQPLIASGTVSGKAFQTSSSWYANPALAIPAAGNYNATSNVFTYSANPPNGEIDTLFFNVGGSCSYTAEIHVTMEHLPEIQLEVDKKNLAGVPSGNPYTVRTGLNDPLALTICSGAGIQLDIDNLGPTLGLAEGNPPLYVEVVFTDPYDLLAGSTAYTFPGSLLPVIDHMTFPIVNTSDSIATLTATLTPYWESDGNTENFNPNKECSGDKLSVILTILPDASDLVTPDSDEKRKRICSGDGFGLQTIVGAFPGGVTAVYLDWEITGISGPGSVTVDAANCSAYTLGSTGRSTAFTNPAGGTLTFNGSDVIASCAAPTITLGNDVDQVRTVEYTITPVIVTTSGDTCPADLPFTYEIVVYPKPQLELDNATGPVNDNAMAQGPRIAICNETSADGRIRVRQWPTIFTEATGDQGDLEYDWSLSPLPAGMTATGPLTGTKIGSDGMGVSKTNFLSPLSGLPILKNTTTSPLDVMVSVIPVYDPVNPDAAGLPSNLDMEGRCAGTTQQIAVTVLPTPDIDPVELTNAMTRVIQQQMCGNDGLLPNRFDFFMNGVNTNMSPWHVEFELLSVDMSAAPNVTRSTVQSATPDGGHPNTFANTNGYETADDGIFTEYLQNNGNFTETVVYTFRPQIDLDPGMETEFCYGEPFTIEVMVYAIPTATAAPAMPAYVCQFFPIDVIGIPGGFPPVPVPGSHIWEIASPQPAGYTGTGQFIDQQAEPLGQFTNSQTARLEGIQPGMIRLYYTWSDSNGCTIRQPIPLDIEVLAAPDVNPVDGPNIVCPQAVTEYSVANPDPNSFYTWTLSSGGIIMSSPNAGNVFIQWNSAFGGPHTLTLTERAPNGCQMQNQLLVTVSDMTNPSAMCPADLTVSTQDDGSYNCGYTVADMNLDVNPADDCGIVSSTHNFQGGGSSLMGRTFPEGTTSVTWTVTDLGGQQMSCSFQITVVDTEDPKILNCPANIFVGTAVDRCDNFVNWSPVQIADNCDSSPRLFFWTSGATLSGGDDIADLFGNGDGDASNDPIQGTPSGEIFNQGETTVHFIAVDAKDSVSTTCSFTITVYDTQLPILVDCPDDRTVSTEADACFGLVADLTGEMTVNDNCPLEFTQSPAAGTPFGTAHQGAVPVTVTATDAGGNFVNCIVQLTLIDTQAPEITDCPDDRTIDTDPGSCQGSVPDLSGELSFTDNCNQSTVSQVPAAGSQFGTKHGDQQQVLVIVTDAAGLADTCVTVLTLRDNQAPVITTCPANDIVYSNTGCQVALGDYASGLVLNDNCAIDTVFQIPAPGFLFGTKLGATVTVRTIVRDFAGLSDTCIFTVVQLPTPAPLVNMPQTQYCIDEPIAPVTASSPQPGATFSWFRDPGLTLPVSPAQISGAQNQFYTPLSTIGLQQVWVAASYAGSTCISDATPVTTLIYECKLDIIDPCACKDTATTLTNGQFSETVTLFGPAGDVWTIQSVTGLFRANSPSPPAAPLPFPAGWTMTEIAPGTYRLTGVHIDSMGYSLTVTNGAVTRTVSNTCYYPNPAFAGVFDTYCQNYTPVALSGSATYPVPPATIPAPRESDRFDVLNQFGAVVQGNITILLPSSLPQGIYSLRYTFNAIDDVPSGNYPGCVQAVAKQVRIFPIPPLALVCNNKGNVSLGTDGTALITADDILEGSYGCYDQYLVSITGKTGNLVDCDDVGKTFQVKVTDPISGNSCWGNILVEDKLAPVITCADVTVSCNNEGLSPNQIGYPTVFDNCGPGNIDLTYAQTPSNLNCNALYDEVINRIWTAKDKTNGMQSNCTQKISFLKANLTQVVFPANMDDITSPSLDCGVKDISPAVTGFPAIAGLPIGGFCEMSVNYEDKTLPICEGSYKVSRTWMVMDKCTNAMISQTQYIIVADKQGPSMTCPTPDKIVVVNPAWNGCGARIFVPAINITDNCTYQNGISVLTSVQSNGSLQQLATNGGFFNIPYGVHTVSYSATDLCGRGNSCTVQITVEDTAPPTAVCNDHVVVSLTDEVTYAFAQTFDDGSHDNCSPTVALLVRRMDNPACPGDDATDFAASVPFYCCDATNSPVMCVLKAFVDKNQNGLQDSNEPYNECMLNVTIQDKIKPVIQCPADITVACLEDLAPQSNGNLSKSVSPNDPISAAYAFTYTHTVDIAGLPADAKVTDLNAIVKIDHEVVDNLVIKLISPTGKSMLLFNGGNCGVGRKHIDAVFDDEGANFSCSGFPVAVAGTVKAQGSLLSLTDGDNPNGTWTFEVTDKAPLGGGLIRNLGVDITYATALSVLPTAFDNASNCGITFSHTDLDQKAQCAAGQVIRRQWRAQDPSGNSGTCIQRITLQDNLPLIVDFPEDLTVTDCKPISDLGASGEPEHNGDCELVAVSFVDEVYDVVPGACYKIVRTWTVVDWCKFDHTKNHSAGGIVLDAAQHLWQDDGDGYFKYVQTIKVIDNVAPLINCPTDTVLVLSDATDCSKNKVLGTLDATDACTPQNQLKVVWTIDYFNNGNIDVTGTSLTIDRNDVPLGVHEVGYKVTDGCGNFSYCNFLMEVRDGKKPTPICINGLSTDLMPATGMVSVPATAFESGNSKDNCTAYGNLTFLIERLSDLSSGQAVPDTNAAAALVFDCDDFKSGQPVQVVLWVGDAAGNWDYCITYIDVQNNGGFDCGNFTGGGTISGKVATEWKANVEEVKVSLSGTGNYAMSSSTGLFNFPAMTPGGSYAVVPEKDDDALNGVSTYDILLIQKHLLGIKPIGTPYCLIAADVNKSNSISVADIITLRKTLLSASDKFPSNTSWRFVDEKFVFPDPKNPWKNLFPEVAVIKPLLGNAQVGFVGVKVGDISGDAKTTSLFKAETRSHEGLLTLRAEDRALEMGEDITVPVHLDDADGLEGFQFTLSFDPALEFTGIEEGNLSADNVGYRFADNGLLTVSWNGDWKPELPVFALKFRVRDQGLLGSMLSIHSALIKAEGYYKEGNDHRFADVAMAFRQPEANKEDGLALYQNIPNPFTGNTLIGFNLPADGEAVLVFHDVSGREVRRMLGEYPAGFHQVELQRSDLPGAGMYYYTLQFQGRQLTRRMSLLD